MRVAAVAGDGVDRLDVLRAELEQRAGAPARRSRARARRAGACGRSPRRRRRRSRPPGRAARSRRAVLILRASSITRRAVGRPGRRRAAAPRASPCRPCRCRAARPARPCSRSSSKISSPSRSGMPVSSGIAPRIGATPRAQVLRREPGRVELVVARRRAEVPEDRVVAARQQREARVLVARPLADVRARDVADVVRVEEQERAEIRGLERRLRPRETVAAQAGEVDPLLPVDRPRRVGRPGEPASHRHFSTS